MKKVWGYGDSRNPEMWEGPFDTRDEAIGEGRERFAPYGFWICRGIEVPADYFLPSALHLVEQMNEEAYDEVGDLAEGFPDVTGAKAGVLADLLQEWASDIDVPFWISDPSTAEEIDEEP